jgi:hypothetical protein
MHSTLKMVVALATVSLMAILLTQLLYFPLILAKVLVKAS